ncbi:unnamed protein product [Ostreobium quekettii]|uniref:Uncharacterized protein n=1 Tax=Ostreobium quekettii TaxID=121088 RepID=A0A8S1ILR4_9CHLO|nr:unnamed protein product [Ostreobium quekettii]
MCLSGCYAVLCMCECGDEVSVTFHDRNVAGTSMEPVAGECVQSTPCERIFRVMAQNGSIAARPVTSRKQHACDAVLAQIDAITVTFYAIAITVMGSFCVKMASRLASQTCHLLPVSLALLVTNTDE